MWTGPQPVRRRLLRKRVSGHRRDHDIERIRCVAAVRGRVGERADDVQHLDDRTRPAVGDDHRQGVLVTRPDVDEMDVEAVDPGQELRDGVQPGLEPPEVVVAAPVPDELLHRRQLHALRRVVDGLLLGPARRRIRRSSSMSAWGTSTRNGRMGVSVATDGVLDIYEFPIPRCEMRHLSRPNRTCCVSSEERSRRLEPPAVARGNRRGFDTAEIRGKLSRSTI